MQYKYVLPDLLQAQLIAVLSCKYLGIYDNTIFTVRYFKGSITYLSCLLTKDGTKETLLSSKLCFSLRSNLTNKDITGTYLSTDTDDTTLIQILQSVIADTRNVTCDLFRPSLVSRDSASYSSIWTDV